MAKNLLICSLFLLSGHLLRAQDGTDTAVAPVSTRSISKLSMDPQMNLQNYVAVAAWAQNPKTGTQQVVRTLLYADVGSIPAGAVVVKAYLYLFAQPRNYLGNVGNPLYGDKNEAVLELAKSNWDTSSAEWGGQPDVVKGSARALRPSQNSRQVDTVDVTGFVASWLLHPDQNHGMVLRLSEESAFRKREVQVPHTTVAFEGAPVHDPLDFSVLANSRIYFSAAATDSLQPRLVVYYKFSNLAVSLYPIPASGYLTMHMTAPESGTAQMEVMDVAGRQITTQTGGVVKGDNVFNIDRVGALPGGAYWLVVRLGQRRVVKKFTVVR